MHPENRWPAHSGNFLGWILPQDFGAVGDGVHDDTTAMQQAIHEAEDTRRPLHIPPGVYRLTATLWIHHAIRIIGSGVLTLYGSQKTDFHTINIPALPPYLTGTVLVQTAPDADAIRIETTGESVVLESFGIRFDPPYKRTGHGIVAQPIALSAGGYDNGILGSRWQDLKVFGHDGDHYAFWLTNVLYGSFYDLHSFGGGGLYLAACSGAGGYYGGLSFVEFFAQVYLAGSAHGIRAVSSETTGLSHSHLNNLLFLRPQCMMANYSHLTAMPPPGPAQHICWFDDDIFSVNMQAQDFETDVQSTVILPKRGFFVDPTGYWPGERPFIAITSNHKLKDVNRHLWSDLQFEDHDPAMVQDMQLPKTTLGPTSGHVHWDMPHQGPGYKKWVGYLENYHNKTRRPQSVVFPQSFVHPPMIVVQPENLDVHCDRISIKFPAFMDSTVSGLIIVEGI